MRRTWIGPSSMNHVTFEIVLAVGAILYSIYAASIYLSQGGTPLDVSSGIPGRASTEFCRWVKQVHWIILGMLLLVPLVLPGRGGWQRVGTAVLRTGFAWGLASTSLFWPYLMFYVSSNLHIGLAAASHAVVAPAVESYHALHGGYPESVEDALDGWRFWVYRLGPECRVLQFGEPQLAYSHWLLDMGNPPSFPVSGAAN